MLFVRNKIYNYYIISHRFSIYSSMLSKISNALLYYIEYYLNLCDIIYMYDSVDYEFLQEC